MAKKTAPTTPNTGPKPNSSILTFFKRTPKEDNDSLFLGGESTTSGIADYSDLYSDDWEEADTAKRRKITNGLISPQLSNGFDRRECTPPSPDTRAIVQLDAARGDAEAKSYKRKLMPFEEDVESEDDLDLNGLVPDARAPDAWIEERAQASTCVKSEGPPCSIDFEGFDNLDDEGEELEQGEELEEQRRALLEMSREETDDVMESVYVNWPICNVSLYGSSENEITIHVNNCLDGLQQHSPPTSVGEPHVTSQSYGETTEIGLRAHRPAKPGQRDPTATGSYSSASSSAFSKLMAGHAEDSAWSAAASAEVAARGRPAYERTCPFYKILTGFSITVDAFRYGAVEGCSAYFLSHFHSDHYIGLTATWSHGPIYCSRVTANLVKQQLRVDPTWVVALDFEKETEVPDTGGAKVVMIPANHCPGSSLFLFEKAIGGKPTRILHCGDFRACRAHLEHPLLKPDILDISGKQRPQKLDICYLDTTYLNPKYAFPSQEAVISACAELCVKLNTASPDNVPDLLPQSKESAAMRKFITKPNKAKTNASGNSSAAPAKQPGRLLVVIGTYSIGKENICLAIARALDSKIYAPTGKRRICACLEDPELNSLLTSDPKEAQVHMTPLFEIRPETLDDYLTSFQNTTNQTTTQTTLFNTKPPASQIPFTHILGFRPTGWTYRPQASSNSATITNPETLDTKSLLEMRPSFTIDDLKPQRGSSPKASCYGVPYSEHSSFRELAAFVCGLRIERVIPTVNVGSAKSRERMRAWVQRWEGDRRRNGCFPAEKF
jgi:DNA cross-link repair 1A protein